MSNAKTSAGLLLYRDRAGRLEVLIAHMGGPFWAHRDDGAWSIVKGEYGEGEDAYEAARREFAEETGAPPPQEGLDVGEQGKLKVALPSLGGQAEELKVVWILDRVTNELRIRRREGAIEAE